MTTRTKWNKFAPAFGGNGGCYECLNCGRKTRETGSGESELTLCRACFDLGDLENGISDNGGTLDTPYWTDYLNIIHKEAAAGRDPQWDTWMLADASTVTQAVEQIKATIADAINKATTPKKRKSEMSKPRTKRTNREKTRQAAEERFREEMTKCTNEISAVTPEMLAVCASTTGMTAYTWLIKNFKAGKLARTKILHKWYYYLNAEAK